MGLVDSAAGAILGMATAGWQDRRQLKQQRKLQAMQIQGQKEMGEFNQGLALDMWDKTNYDAQRKQMEKAGLNIGLMYQGGGQGGTTQTPTGSVQGGTAAGGSGEIGMGIQTAMQLKLLKAQKENIEADTAKKQAETPKAETEINVGKAQEIKLKAEGLEAGFKAKMAEIEYNIKSATSETEKERLMAEKDLTIANASEAEANAWIASTTIAEKQRQARLETKAREVAIKAQEAGIIKTKMDTKVAGRQIEKLTADIRVALAQNAREWDKLTIAEREIYVKEALMKNAKEMTEFSTSTANQIRQWTSVLTDFIPFAGGMQPAPNKIGF